MTPFRGAYQGIEGSHSLLVLNSFFAKYQSQSPSKSGEAPLLEALPQSTFRQVATSVVSGRAELGVLPIDNAIAGTVREGYDLIAQYDLVPVAEVEWRMDHRLLATPGAELENIREVWAHPLVLQECGKFLSTLVGARIIPCEDTGVAAQEISQLKDPSKAAIAPPEAAKKYNLVELAENIADHPDNFTRFLVFRSHENFAPLTQFLQNKNGHARKTSLLLSAAHESGSLARCVAVLAEAGVNLSKLESRPKLGKAWEYLFYIDFEGDVQQARVAAALETLRKNSSYLHILGSYDVLHSSLPSSVNQVKASSTPRELSPGSGVGSDTTLNDGAGWDASLLPSSSKSWPKVSRAAKPQGSRVNVGGVIIGGDEFVVIAGPCSVESREQVLSTARAVKQSGAQLLRGGVFKPRTNPYAFQGMGWEGLSLLAEAGRASGMPTVSEVMSLDQVERMAREVDVLQIGARNMQNYDLLKAVGKTDRTILLKRGLSASLDELLSAAEYILAEGNPNVILCERGIRTFETATRNTLDLSAVPVLRERTHLPIVVDPSHGVGVRRWIRPLCRAAKAVGAHGILVEVHPNPEEAKSDKDQALTFEDFKNIMSDLNEIPGDISRQIF